MVYRMTVRSNPRVLAVYVVLPFIVLAGGASLFLLGVLYGLVALAAALVLAWTFLKQVRRQLATRVETLTDEILFTLHGDEKILIPWDKVRVAGIAHDPSVRGRRGRRRVFVYNEEDDKMLALTDEFENLDGLVAELREKTAFRELDIAPGETLKDRLRELVQKD